MAFTDFTNSPSNGATVTANGATYTYNSTKARWEVTSSAGGGGLSSEEVQDLVGAQIATNGSHTGISFSYDDSGDGAIDASVSSAATLTTARNIGGVAFNGSADISLPGVNAAGTQNTTGSAATLTTARNIGGVSFDGSADISLPGVNAAGNQNTTGSAATLTSARNIGGVSFDGSTSINLPGVNAAGNQNTTGSAGSAGSAATLTTARNIGGVSFDGSTSINLPGVNAAGNQSTTGNATTATTATTAATLTTARNIGGVAFNGSADISLPGVNVAGTQNTTGSAGSLTSTNNGHIEIDPDGSGLLKIKGNSTSGSGAITLNCEVNTHGVKIQAPPHSAGATYTLTLPNNNGNADQVLKTDGSGGLAWVDQSGGGSAISTSDAAPSSPSDGDLWFDTTELVPYVYYADGTSNQWVEFYPGSASSGGGGGGVTTYANIAALPSSGNTGGDLAFVTDVKAFYGWDGTEWDRIFSGPNENVAFSSSPAASYNLSPSGAATSVTIAAADPEGFPITYGYVTNPSNQAQATITQSGGTFTITPTTTQSDAGDFSIKFTATDGVHVASATSAVSLKFWEYVNWTTFNNYYNNHTGWQFNDNGTDIEVWNNANLGTASATHTTYTIADGQSGQTKVYYEFTTNSSQVYYGAGFVSTTKTNSDNHLRDVTTVGSYPGHYGGEFSASGGATYSTILDRNTKKIHYWKNGVYDTTRSRVMANGTYYAALGDGDSSNIRSSSTKSILRGVNSNGVATFTYDADTLWQGVNTSSIAAIGGSAGYGSSGSPVGSYHLIMQDSDSAVRKVIAGAAQSTLSSLSTFTIACWAKQTSSSTIAFVTNGDKNSAGNSFGENCIYCAANGNWEFHPRQYNGSSYGPVSIGTVGYGNWLHLVISCNVSAGTLQIWASKDYFGDIKNDSSAASGISINALDFATWYLGGSNGNADDGNSRSQIDDLKIFSSNLTSTQAESVYNSTAASAGYVTNLDHHFKFENNLSGTYLA